MQTHPFIGSVINRVMGITLSVVAWMMYSWLLFCYGGEEIWIACLDGLVSVGLLAAAGFLYGYVDGTIHALQIQVALAVLVQAISLAGAFELQVLLEQGNAGDFVDSVSLRLVFGILCWIILLQWYRMNRTDESDFEEISGTEADKGQEEAVPAGETFLDRVSVKDGSRIHIIHLEELLYLHTVGTLGAQAVVNRFVDMNSTAPQMEGWSMTWFVFAGYALVVAVLFAVIFKYKHNPRQV